MLQSEGYITVEDGVRLFYRKLGTRPKTLIVLNGYYLIDDFSYLADHRTVLFCDLRNRGQSDHITDASKLTRGILQDVDDLEAVRRHFGFNAIDLMAHSYAGFIPV